MFRKPLRVFLAALAHETNSFSPLPTTVRSFEEGELYRPDDPSTSERAKHFPGFGDAMSAAFEHGDEIVRGTCAWAQPSGPLARRAYESIRDEILAQLSAAAPVDAVFLVLHGAMMADGYPDCEGDILKRARDIVGAQVPMGALLDLHGNMSQTMIDNALVVACKEYPHTDYPQRARELYGMLSEVAHGKPTPRTTLRRVPMMALLGTTTGPMFDFVRELEKCEGSNGILSVSAMHGFAWSDNPDTGAAIVVLSEATDLATQAADRLADRFASELFGLRARGAAARLPLEQALDFALAARCDAGPVVLADGSDNAGGGASSDSTFVLEALLRRGVKDAAFGMIWDPQAVKVAADLGVGARATLRIGGKVGVMSGRPLDVSAEVIAVREDAIQVGLGGEWKAPLGLAVALRIDGVDVVLNSNRSQVFSPACFTEMGIDLKTKTLIALKSTQHFREGFDPIASSTLYCDAPGTLSQDLAALPYKRLTRPIWPLDPVQFGAA